jgi:hypothetical protein
MAYMCVGRCEELLIRAEPLITRLLRAAQRDGVVRFNDYRLGDLQLMALVASMRLLPIRALQLADNRITPRGVLPLLRGRRGRQCNKQIGQPYM